MLNAITDQPALLALAAVLGLAVLAVAWAIGIRRGRATRSMLWTALALWLLAIAIATLGSTVTTQLHGQQGLNLVPFQEIERGFNHRGTDAWINVVGNVALFMPLGFLVACLTRGGLMSRIAAALLTGLLLSSGIETAQYILGRVADVDDIILNATGALVGGIVGAVVSTIVVRARRPRTRTPD